MNKITLKIQGMHCASCELLIERKFKTIAGVTQVMVSQPKGVAQAYCLRTPDMSEFKNAIADTGYQIGTGNGQGETNPNYAELGTIFFLVVMGFLILKELNLVPDIGITNNMSYGFVFLIGLVAAMSTCMAVTGGLLLAIAAKQSDQDRELSGWQKFKPNLYFNLGRIISYTVLGGVIGAAGSVLTISARVNGLITIFASAVMLILGLQMLKLFPWLARFQPKMPKVIGHKIHVISNPFFLGASTFFLPCGFTQALQLYVLSRGSWQVGALTMLVFSLGTLPALLSLSAISSFINGTLQNYFIKFAGVVVVLLGIFNIQNGINLLGINFNVTAQTVSDTDVTVVNGKQIAKMTVNGLNYSPSRFTVVKDVPVEFQVDGTAAAGCGQVIIFPELGLTKFLLKDRLTTIEFTPKELGEISFNCPMGMMTRGAGFTVVENTKGIVAAPSTSIKTQTDQDFIDNGPIDPNAQQLFMEISRQKGISPNTFTVKKGIPIQLNIDVQARLGGCMSTILVPEYNIAHQMKFGQSNFKFTPTNTGTVYFTCSMGSRLGYFNVID